MPVELNISSDELQIVQTILQQHIPQRTVWAFWFAREWQGKAVFGFGFGSAGRRPSLSLAEHADLVDAFSESDFAVESGFGGLVFDWRWVSGNCGGAVFCGAGC